MHADGLLRPILLHRPISQPERRQAGPHACSERWGNCRPLPALRARYGAGEAWADPSGRRTGRNDAGRGGSMCFRRLHGVCPIPCRWPREGVGRRGCGDLLPRELFAGPRWVPHRCFGIHVRGLPHRTCRIACRTWAIHARARSFCFKIRKREPGLAAKR